MKDPRSWTVPDLREQLQRAVDLELYAAPLYLCALYSIRDLDPDRRADWPEAARHLESVAIQEMLHLQLAANLCCMLGHAPRFEPPAYETGTLPVIEPAGLPGFLAGYRIGIGPLDEAQLKLFCTLEFPEAPGEPEWRGEHVPHTLGEFYQALRLGVDAHWDAAAGDGWPTRQQVCFPEYLAANNREIGFSQRLASKVDALAALDAIVAEGEGASGDAVPVAYVPVAAADRPDDPGAFDPRESHYQKCLHLLQQATGELPGGLPPVYATIERPDAGTATAIADAQAALDRAFLLLLDRLTASYRASNETDIDSGLTSMADGFWPAMFAMQGALTAVWRAGATPRLGRRQP